MNIIPISASYPIQSSSVPGASARTAGGEMPFKNVLEQAISNVEETQAVAAQDSINLALGEVDDLAEIGINTTKAELAMTLLVTTRNQLLDAYNELMRISL